MLGSTSVKARIKRSSPQHLSKMSVQDLSVELAKKHVSLKRMIFK